MKAANDVEYGRVKSLVELFGSLLENREDIEKKLRLVEETIALGNEKLAKAFLRKTLMEFLTQIISYFKGKGLNYKLSGRFREFLDELEKALLEERVQEAFRHFIAFSIQPSDIITEGVGEEEELALPETEYHDALDYVEKIFDYMQMKNVGGEEGKEISEMFIQMKKKLREVDFKGLKELGERLTEKLLLPREQFKFNLELKLERLERILKRLQDSREILGENAEKIDKWWAEFLEVKKAVKEGFLLKSDLKIKELTGEIEPYRERLMGEIVKRVIVEAEEMMKGTGGDTSFEEFLLKLARKRLEERRYKEAYQFAVKVKLLLRWGEGGVNEALKKRLEKYTELVGALVLPGEVKSELLKELKVVERWMKRGEGTRAQEGLKAFEKRLLELAEG